MTDLRISGWKKWQGPAVYDIKRKRDKNSKRPLRLSFVAVAAEFHDDVEATPDQGSFEQYAAALGAGANAEGWWVRVLQYLALRDPLEGVIRGVPREKFGPVVLSRPWDLVSQAKGAKVYDALLSSRLATRETGREVTRETGGATGPPTSREPGPGGLGLASKAESTTAFDVAVDPPSGAPAKAVVAPDGEATADHASPCSCADGLTAAGSFCGRCQAGRDRRRAWKRVRDEERGSEARATAAASRAPSEPRRAEFRMPRAAS